MPARFLDASVFVHAYLRPRRALKDHEEQIKKKAQAIVARVSQGESVVTSAVHFIEVANILENWLPLEDAQSIQRGICTRDNVEILSTGGDDLIEALSLGTDIGLGTSDALALVHMQRVGLEEIYSFDRDFDRVGDVKRIAE